MGRVFCAVVPEDNQEVAVKVVLPEDVASLESEYITLVNAGPGLPLVKPCSQFISGEFGSGHALVENLLGRTHRTTLLEKAFNTLSTLHKAKLSHGDGRLANLIITKGDPVWADLCASRTGGRYAFADDMTALAQSILGVEPEEMLRQSALAYAVRVEDKEKGKEECAEALKVDAASIMCILDSLPRFTS
jgi:tRNA A-37 threonylcarbamoyl transferase component Bud32